jgi:long-subunit fatty acid transport protein
MTVSTLRLLDAGDSQEPSVPATRPSHHERTRRQRRWKRHDDAFPRLLIACCALIAMTAFLPPAARAGSFRIYDHSASATGQASAFTAQADDASAGYYNPAGMTQLRGVQFSAGTTLIAGGFSFQNGAGTQANGDLRGSVAVPPPSNVYMTANLKDLGIGSSDSTTIGLAVFSPFGTLTRWPDSSPFSTATTKAAFELIDIRPSIAFRPLPDLAIGLGADIYTFSGAFGEGQVERQFRWPGGLGIPAGTGMELNGRDTAAGFNASLLYTPLRNGDGRPLVNIGLIYRSQATLHLDGQLLAGGTRVADARTTFVVPQVLTGGIALWPVRDNEREWKLELDVDYTGWKSVRNLDTTLSNGLAIATPGQLDQRLHRHGRHGIQVAEPRTAARLGRRLTRRLLAFPEGDSRSDLQPCHSRRRQPCRLHRLRIHVPGTRQVSRGHPLRRIRQSPQPQRPRNRSGLPGHSVRRQNRRRERESHRQRNVSHDLACGLHQSPCEFLMPGLPTIMVE